VELVDNDSRYLVITRRGRDLLVPVTTEQYLRERIRDVEAARNTVAQSSADEAIPDLERWRREEKPKMEREFQEMLREMAPHVSKEELERMRLNFQQTLVSTEEALRGAASMRPLADSL